MENIIEMKSVEKVFANERALENVNLAVKKGEIFGFLGPSGAGKTTTIKILTGQLSATDGEAQVFKVPTSALNGVNYRKKFGVLTDNSGLYQRLSIYENLKLYCKLFDVPLSRISEVLAMVNLKGEKKKMVSKLSKGMLQRVILARTFLHEPELLFLDEPTAALDPVNSKHIHDGLRQLNAKGTTIFLTTHDMNEAELLCNRVALLNKGKVQLLDEPKKLCRAFSDSTVIVELINGSKVALSKGPEGAEEMNKYMVNNEIVSIYSNEPTLGDIFVEVTGRDLV